MPDFKLNRVLLSQLNAENYASVKEELETCYKFQPVMENIIFSGATITSSNVGHFLDLFNDIDLNDLCLDLSGTQLSNEALEKLLTGLNNKNIKALNLSKNKISEPGLQHLIEFLQNNPSVQSLSLNQCQLTADMMASFIAALPNAKLLTLSLQNNHLGDKGLLQLGAVLQYTALKTLHLIGNSATVTGLQQLAKALKGSTVNNIDFNPNSTDEADFKNAYQAIHSAITPRYDIAKMEHQPVTHPAFRPRP